MTVQPLLWHLKLFVRFTTNRSLNGMAGLMYVMLLGFADKSTTDHLQTSMLASQYTKREVGQRRHFVGSVCTRRSNYRADKNQLCACPWQSMHAFWFVIDVHPTHQWLGNYTDQWWRPKRSQNPCFEGSTPHRQATWRTQNYPNLRFLTLQSKATIPSLMVQLLKLFIRSQESFVIWRHGVYCGLVVVVVFIGTRI